MKKNKSSWQTCRCYCKRNAAAQPKQQRYKRTHQINKLANEYLRLAYHGLRAKDKVFNATLKTDFDEKVEKINIIPQDIGRVILNLYFARGKLVNFSS